MEVYILNDLLLREELIDRFESLIWTERVASVGDFQLVIHSTADTRRFFQKGQRIGCNRSRRIMIVENIDDADDSEGRSVLTVSGRSLESILEDRVAKEAFFTAPPEEGEANKWVLTGRPADLARYIFKHICVDGALSPNDVIPFYVDGSLYQTGTISEPEEEITIELSPATVYDVLTQLCDAYALGFRLYKNPANSDLHFDVYAGNDVTTVQSTGVPVIFSPDLENLQNITQLTSIEQYKNVALVIAKNGSRWVYANGVDPTIEGFDRRVLLVQTSGVDLPAGAELNARLDQIGKEELAKVRPLVALDGELSQHTEYIYDSLLPISTIGTYALNDLVELRDSDGVTNQMRVTEYIMVDDEQGERAYPTLKNEEFITPGSWYAWDFGQVWDNVPDATTWGTLP